MHKPGEMRGSECISTSAAEYRLLFVSLSCSRIKIAGMTRAIIILPICRTENMTVFSCIHNDWLKANNDSYLFPKIQDLIQHIYTISALYTHT